MINFASFVRNTNMGRNEFMRNQKGQLQILHLEKERIVELKLPYLGTTSWERDHMDLLQLNQEKKLKR